MGPSAAHRAAHAARHWCVRVRVHVAAGVCAGLRACSGPAWCVHAHGPGPLQPASQSPPTYLCSPRLGCCATAEPPQPPPSRGHSCVWLACEQFTPLAWGPCLLGGCLRCCKLELLAAVRCCNPTLLHCTAAAAPAAAAARARPLGGGAAARLLFFLCACLLCVGTAAGCAAVDSSWRAVESPFFVGGLMSPEAGCLLPVRRAHVCPMPVPVRCEAPRLPCPHHPHPGLSNSVKSVMAPQVRMPFHAAWCVTTR